MLGCLLSNESMPLGIASVTFSNIWHGGIALQTHRRPRLKGPVWATPRSFMVNSESVFEITALLWAWVRASEAISRNDASVFSRSLILEV